MNISARPLRRSLAAIALVTLVASGCGLEKTDRDNDASDASFSDGSEAPDAGGSDAPGTQTPAADGECSYVEGAPAAKEVDMPPAAPQLPDALEGVIATSIGDIEITLDAAAAPCTVNSFVTLAQQGYFDDTTCHRLTTEGIKVLQCGDPTATGTGGPGYSFADELTGDETYPNGTLAMANSGPDTNGSQFFMVYGETPLPPSYTVFGTFSDASVKTVTDAAKDGTVEGGSDGTPKTEVKIAGVTFS